MLQSSQWGAQFAAQVAATLDPVTPRDNKPTVVRAVSAAVTAAPKLPPSSSDAEAVSSEKTPVTVEPAPSLDAIPSGQTQQESSTVEAAAAAASATPVEAASLPTSGSVPSDAESRSSPLPSATVLCDEEIPQQVSTEEAPNPLANSDQPQQPDSSSADESTTAKMMKTSETTTTVKTNPQLQAPSQPLLQQQSKPPGLAAAPEATQDNNGKRSFQPTINGDVF